VIDGRVDVRDLKYIRLPEPVADSLRLGVGDLLFVRTNGRREYIGRCAVFHDDPAGALFASYLIRARLKPGSAHPDFAQIYLTTSEGRAFLSERASNAADGKFNINTQTIKGVLLPLPHVGEQEALIETLQACDAHIAGLEREAATLDELFRALLEELMTGRLSALSLVESSMEAETREPDGRYD
jgi:type I restriction enzyme, S subunit